MEKLNMTLTMTLEEIKEDLRLRILEANAYVNPNGDAKEVGPYLGVLLDGMAESIYIQNQTLLKMMKEPIK
jgi:hypothetical protein